MIILQISQKYFKNKLFWTIVSIVYILIIVSISYIALNSKEFLSLDMGLINEKKVSFMYVFSNNIFLMFKNILFGFLTFGVYSLFSISQNVLTLGIISNSLIHEGYSILFYKMIPHGLFELLGLAISLSIIIFCYYKILLNIPKVVKKDINLKDLFFDIINYINSILIIEFFLFGIAGIIEVLISQIKFL